MTNYRAVGTIDIVHAVDIVRAAYAFDIVHVVHTLDVAIAIVIAIAKNIFPSCSKGPFNNS